MTVVGGATAKFLSRAISLSPKASKTCKLLLLYEEKSTQISPQQRLWALTNLSIYWIDLKQPSPIFQYKVLPLDPFIQRNQDDLGIRGTLHNANMVLVCFMCECITLKQLHQSKSFQAWNIKPPWIRKHRPNPTPYQPPHLHCLPLRPKQPPHLHSFARHHRRNAASPYLCQFCASRPCSMLARVN